MSATSVKPAPASVTVGELADNLKATIKAPPGMTDAAARAVEIKGVAPLGSANGSQLSFLNNPEYERLLPTTKAAAIFVAKPSDACQGVQLVLKNPYWAFAKTSQIFFREEYFTPGVHAAAVVAATAQIAASATVLANAYVGEHVQIGERVLIYPGVYLGRGVKIGDDTVIRANAVIEHGVSIGQRVLIHGGSVIGADGFGFAPGEESIAKIPQIGRVIVEDDVEVGGLTTVDRGAMGDTVIGAGSKLDSHVHVGHNVIVGKHCMLCGLAGVAGSAKIGDWSVIAGHSGVSNHVEIAPRVTVGGMSGVTKSLPEAGTYMGFPAMPAREWRRQAVYERRLPELEERVKQLEKLLAEKKS